MGAEAMTIEVTRAHCLGGGNDVEIGTRLRAPGDLTIEEAEAKVRQDYAVVVPPVTARPVATSRPEKEKQDDPDKAPEPGTSEDTEEATDEDVEEATDGEVQTGEPAVETRDPAPPTSPTPTKPRTSRKGHKGA